MLCEYSDNIFKGKRRKRLLKRLKLAMLFSILQSEPHFFPHLYVIK